MGHPWLLSVPRSRGRQRLRSSECLVGDRVGLLLQACLDEPFRFAACTRSQSSIVTAGG